jgi:hypothetical protein
VVAELSVAHVRPRKAAAYFSDQNPPVLSDMLLATAERSASVLVEVKLHSALAFTLKQFPTGTCLLVRDDAGREWYVGPADQVVSNKLRKAV